MTETRKRLGTALASLAVVAGALIIGPQLFHSTNADAAPAVDEEKVVKCTIGAVATLDPAVTDADKKEFTATLLAGTASCDDKRGAAERIIEISYDNQKITGSGNCRDFTVDDTKLNVKWILADGKPPVDGMISMSALQVKLDDADPPGITEVKGGDLKIDGGPLNDATVEGDPSSVKSSSTSADCKSGGANVLAAIGVVTFTPKTTNAPDQPTER